MKRLFLFITTSMVVSIAQAQMPESGFMQGKGNSSTAISFCAENYDKVFLVPNEIDGVPVFDEVNITSVNFYNAYGISDNFDISIHLPYISATGQASAGELTELGFSNKRSGVQDGSLYLKYRPLSTELGSSKLNFILTGGVKTPLSKYKVDEGLQSIIAIGNRATQLNLIGATHIQAQSGFFVTTQIGYSYRTTDVPNALLGELKLGIAKSKFYADAYLAGQTSDGGINILGEGFTGFFPATDVSYHRVGLNLYFPLIEGFGIAAGASKIISGRNVGASTGFSGSIVYQIN